MAELIQLIHCLQPVNQQSQYLSVGLHVSQQSQYLNVSPYVMYKISRVNILMSALMLISNVNILMSNCTNSKTNYILGMYILPEFLHQTCLIDQANESLIHFYKRCVSIENSWIATVSLFREIFFRPSSHYICDESLQHCAFPGGHPSTSTC